MKLTRKQFLGSVVTGFIGLALRPRAAEAAVVDKAMAERLAKLVGTSFTIRSQGQEPVKFVLNKLENKKPSNGTTQFSLEFVAPAGEKLAEGTYDVEHKQLDGFRMFVTPLPEDHQGHTWYRADFNLLT